ncbi:MAG: FGGY family carbohydrate kinase, partial [Oscillospiraceae bacterium]
MALAGLDVGTSGCKMVVFDLKGDVICSEQSGYSEYGDDGIREISPKEVIESVFDVIRRAAKSSPEPIEAFAVASLGESAVCVGADGEYLCNSMVTGDKRGIEEALILADRFGRGHIMELTGLPASEMYALPKLMWLNAHTNALKAARFVFCYEDFVGYMLTGKRKISYSLASRTMMFDINRYKWNEELMQVVGLDGTKLSTPCQTGEIVGRVLPEIAKELGLSDST